MAASRKANLDCNPDGKTLNMAGNKRSPTKKNTLGQGKVAAVKDAGWPAAKVKMELELRGWSLAALSRAHNYSPTAAGRALRVAWPQMEEVIADTLGVRPAQIWPDRYDSDGISLKYKPRRNVTARRKGGTRR